MTVKDRSPSVASSAKKLESRHEDQDLSEICSNLEVSENPHSISEATEEPLSSIDPDEMGTEGRS